MRVFTSDPGVRGGCKLCCFQGGTYTPTHKRTSFFRFRVEAIAGGTGGVKPGETQLYEWFIEHYGLFQERFSYRYWHGRADPVAGGMGVRGSHHKMETFCVMVLFIMETIAGQMETSIKIGIIATSLKVMEWKQAIAYF